jgi:hypothetical protein
MSDIPIRYVGIYEINILDNDVKYEHKFSRDKLSEVIDYMDDFSWIMKLIWKNEFIPPLKPCEAYHRDGPYLMPSGGGYYGNVIDVMCKLKNGTLNAEEISIYLNEEKGFLNSENFV